MCETAVPDPLSISEVARRSGEPVDRLREWRDCGLIGKPDAEHFTHEDVEVIRLIGAALRRGVSLEAVIKVEREQRLMRHSLQHLFPGGIGPSYSLAETAEELGIDLVLLRRVVQAAGLYERGDVVRAEDFEVFGKLKSILDAGFSAEALVEILKVYADALGRVAEAETKLVHFHVHSRLRASGVPAGELLERTDAWIEKLEPISQLAIPYFHRKGRVKASTDDVVVHMMEEAAAVGDVPGQLTAAVLFVDLSSFTPLAAEMGDLTAAGVVQRFSDLVRATASGLEGRVVKQIGDAFMIVFASPALAVSCAVDIDDQSRAQAQFPGVRAGVHYGPVLYREGDYIGSNVNTAARVADAAGPHQILVTSEARRKAGRLPRIDFLRIGKRRLKGLPNEVEIFEARPKDRPGEEKVIDRVCGMELSPLEVAAHLNFGGQHLAFCSESCLRKFVLAPESYVGEK